MLQVLRDARNYYAYLKNHPDNESVFYQSDLDVAEKRMYQIENAFILDLDAVVPALGYYAGMLNRKSYTIQQVHFEFQDNLYSFLYLISQDADTLLRNSCVKARCSSFFDSNATMEDIFDSLVRDIDIIGVSIYLSEARPNYLCMPEHVDNLKISPLKRAVFMNQDEKMRNFILQIIQGNLRTIGGFREEDGRFLDIRSVRNTLPDYYCRKMLKMPED